MVFDEDVHKKVNNFFKALANLKAIVGKEPPYDPITEAGMVSLFEICFADNQGCAGAVLADVCRVTTEYRRQLVMRY